MLYTASFYASDHWVGRLYRVSRSHPRGQKTQWDVLPFNYPQRDLLRAVQHGDLDYDTFQLAYLKGLDDAYERTPELRDWVQGTPALGDFTLLCFERAGQPCHRLTLARWLVERAPSLEVGGLR